MVRLEKLANNLTVMKLGVIKVWFSYETPIAVKVPGSEVLITERNYSMTTARHKGIIKKYAMDNFMQHESVNENRFELLLDQLDTQTMDLFDKVW